MNGSEEKMDESALEHTEAEAPAQEEPAASDGQAAAAAAAVEEEQPQAEDAAAADEPMDASDDVKPDDDIDVDAKEEGDGTEVAEEAAGGDAAGGEGEAKEAEEEEIVSEELRGVNILSHSPQSVNIVNCLFMLLFYRATDQRKPHSALA